MASRSSFSTRRRFLKVTGAAALGAPVMAQGAEQGTAAGGSATRGLPPLKITEVRVIVTCPGRNYVLEPISKPCTRG